MKNKRKFLSKVTREEEITRETEITREDKFTKENEKRPVFTSDMNKFEIKEYFLDCILFQYLDTKQKIGGFSVVFSDLNCLRNTMM